MCGLRQVELRLEERQCENKREHTQWERRWVHVSVRVRDVRSSSGLCCQFYALCCTHIGYFREAAGVKRVLTRGCLCVIVFVPSCDLFGSINMTLYYLHWRFKFGIKIYLRCLFVLSIAYTVYMLDAGRQGSQ